MGHYEDIHYFNKEHTPTYDHRVYSFVRWSDKERLIILSNFDAQKSYELDLKVPAGVIRSWGLQEGDYPLEEQLYRTQNPVMKFSDEVGTLPVKLAPLESVILRLK